jgi:DNA-binding transcriptional LysR family regulator
MRLKIDLRQLECFVAIAEEGSFRAAAERLHLSQPPLSRQIKLLEEELGVSLFERGSAGVELTGAGSAFLHEARGTLRKAQQAIAAAQNHAVRAPRTLQVGFSTFIDPDIIPAIEPAYQKQIPGGTLAANLDLSVTLIERLERNTLDVAVIGMPCDTRGLTAEAVHSEPLMILLPAGHPLARHKILSFSQLRDEPMFWPSRRMNPALCDYLEDIVQKLDCVPTNLLVAPVYYLLLLSRVARGQGVSLIPSSLSKIRRQGVVFRPLREKDFWIGLGIAHDNTPPTPERDALVRVLRQFARRHLRKFTPERAPSVGHYRELKRPPPVGKRRSRPAVSRRKRSGGASTR